MPRLMSQAAGCLLCGALVAPCALAAVKEPEKPDREMLRMMEFLKEMEMLQQMEMMREMQEAENGYAPSRNASARKAPPAKNQGTPK
jgi:hypothetical protein